MYGTFGPKINHTIFIRLWTTNRRHDYKTTIVNDRIRIIVNHSYIRFSTIIVYFRIRKSRLIVKNSCENSVILIVLCIRISVYYSIRIIAYYSVRLIAYYSIRIIVYYSERLIVYYRTRQFVCYCVL